MTNIYIKANGATLLVNCDGKITSGTVGLPVTIEYNNEWRGLFKNISFRAGGIVRVRQNVATETTVPWEILRKSGIPLEIGIEGRNEDESIVFPTVWYSVGRILEGARGEIPAAPNPSNGEDIGGNSSINDDIISKSFVWSSKNTVDKLCPAFTESGPVVTCEPVEDYPLGVKSKYAGEEEPGVLALYHGGKNLIPKIAPSTTTKDGVIFTINDDGSWTIGGDNTIGSSREPVNRWSAEHLRGKRIVINGNVGGKIYTYVHLHHSDGTATWSWLKGDEANKLTGVVPNDVVKMDIGVTALAGFESTTVYPQVEFGAVSTDFEPPKESQTYTVDLTTSMFDGLSVYDWETGLLYNVLAGRWFQEDLETGEFIDIGGDEDMAEYPVKKIRSIPALSGVNCLSSYTDKAENTCITTVSGKADPVAIIEKLTNAILALGDNV